MKGYLQKKHFSLLNYAFLYTIIIIFLVDLKLILLFLFPAKGIVNIDVSESLMLLALDRIFPAFLEEFVYRLVFFESFLLILPLAVAEKEQRKTLLSFRLKNHLFGESWIEIVKREPMRLAVLVFVIFFSSFVFAFHHVLAGYGWNKFIPGLLAGTAFGIAYLRFGLAGAFLVHFLHNFYILAIAILFIEESRVFRYTLEILAISLILASLLPILAMTQEWLSRKITLKNQ